MPRSPPAVGDISSMPRCWTSTKLPFAPRCDSIPRDSISPSPAEAVVDVLLPVTRPAAG